MQHIFPITGKFRGLKNEDGTYKPLDEKDKKHLINALEDMWYFVKAVHDRIREYKKWGGEMDTWLKQESAKSAKLKPVADKALARITTLNNDVKSLKFEGPGTEGYWKTRLPELEEMAKTDKYADIPSVGNIRDLGNRQDEMVSRCRQYVKGLRQDMILQDTSDPEVRKLVSEVLDRCQQILRNKHDKECI
jgi:hypothetical protein